MKYRVRITKQPKYQTGGSRTLGDFSNMTEDQLENGPVYGFRPEPESKKQVVPVTNTMQELTPVSIPVAAQPVAMKGVPVSISDLRKRPEYTGISIVDFLNQLGLPSSKPFRAKLAKNIGITNYTGTSAQNLKLIDYLNDPDNLLIDLGGKAPSSLRPRAQWTPSPYTPHDIQWPSVPSQIQQTEGLSANQLAAAAAGQLAGVFAPEILSLLSTTRYYPLDKALPPPRIPGRPQIPGPRNLPGRPFGGWTSSSGHVWPFQTGGEQDQQQQIIEVVKAYAQKSGVDPKTILLQLQKMQPKQQQQAIQQMYAAVSQDAGGEDMSGNDMYDDGMMQDDGTEYAAYGGQMGYGLDLGARRLWMNQDSDESSQVNDSIEEVPRDEANIEAEGGETALIPNQDDRGYTHKKIKGNRHTEGGVPLNVPEGTFIYSDTKKMKLGGPVLKMFGKSEKSTKKFTPATLAKQYNLDKYRAILEDPKSDPIAKRTAELMLQNYEKKLSQLALVQESKKGFPQGIPQVAQNYYNQMLAASGKQGEDIEGTQEDRQELQEETQPQAMYGMGFKYGGGLYKAQNGTQYPTTAEYASNPDNSTQDSSWKGYPYSYPESDKRNFTQNDLLGNNSFSDLHMEKDPSLNTTAAKIELKNLPSSIASDNNATKTDLNKITNVNYTGDDLDNNYQYYIPGGSSEIDKIPYDTAFSKRNRIKKMYPFIGAVKLPNSETAYLSNERAIAAMVEQANARRQAANMLGGKSALYNPEIGAIANIIAQGRNQNASIFNRASEMLTNTQNKQRLLDYQRGVDLHRGMTTADQQYIDALNLSDNEIAQAKINDLAHQAERQVINATQSPYYGLNRNNYVVFKYPGARKDMFNPKTNQNNDGFFDFVDTLMQKGGYSYKEAVDAAVKRYGRQSQATG